MGKRLILVSTLIGALVSAACEDQQRDPTAPSVGSLAVPAAESTALRSGIRHGRLKLPAGARLTDHFSDGLSRALDPDDYTCPSTRFGDWIESELDQWSSHEPEIFDLLYNQLLADLVPSLEALFLQTEDTPQYFGYHGEYTRIMLKTERDAKRFWDIFSDDIQLIGVHGTMLLDIDRVAAGYMEGFREDDGSPITPERARALAILVRDGVRASETLDGGNHPLLSLSAFAISTFGGPIPDKIVMGDGVFLAQEALGFGDVAPQAIYAHEFAHHIQFEHDYFSDPVPGATTQAERTRYTELMADAMSAYFLTHARGAAMNRKRVELFLQVFFGIGDCGFTYRGHHGTPNQRMAAAQFGFDLAAGSQKQGHILPSEEFHELFVAAYPGLTAPDAM